MRRVYLGPLLALVVWGVALLSAQAGSMAIGENWLGGNPVAQDLSTYGGQLYRTYFQSPTQDGEPQRIRLIRYPQTVTQAQVAAMTTRHLWWELGNEVNIYEQDGGLITPAQATAFVPWYHDTVAAIKAGDPTARILGPSVLDWTNSYGGSEGLGRDSYQMLRDGHLQRYGTLPVMEELTDDELEEIFVHECGHILVNEMRGDPDDWLDHEERVVSTLTKAFLWVRSAFAEGPDLSYPDYDG